MVESFKKENESGWLDKWTDFLDINGGWDGLKKKLTESCDYSDLGAEKLLHNLARYSTDGENVMVDRILNDLKELDKLGVIVDIDKFLNK